MFCHSKHLGSYLQCRAVVHRDITYRVSQARKAFGQLARPFYSKRNVNLNTKAQVFRSLVLARHTFHAHVWAWFTENDIQKWANGLRDAAASLVRMVVRPIAPFHFTVTQLLALANLSGPIDLMHVNRLRYVKRAVRAAPGLLWRVLRHTNHACSWVSALQLSFVWFDRHFPGTFALPLQDPWDCIQIVALDEHWNGRVRRAQASALRYHAASAQGVLWTHRIESSLQSLAERPLLPTPTLNMRWQCRLYDTQFDSKTALAVHSRQVHGYVALLKYYISPTNAWPVARSFFKGAVHLLIAMHLLLAADLLVLHGACLRRNDPRSCGS